MLRELDMGAISDGRLYRHSDMVKRVVTTARAVPIAAGAWEIPLC